MIATPRRNRARTWAAIAFALSLASAAFAGSETPPEGPPWKRDFGEALSEGLRDGKPVFVYLTKTH